MSCSGLFGMAGQQYKLLLDQLIITQLDIVSSHAC